jgi:hypothetical protein
MQRVSDGESLWLGVGEEGVSLLQHSSLQLIVKYTYASIVTFGGCQVLLSVFPYDQMRSQEMVF